MNRLKTPLESVDYLYSPVSTQTLPLAVPALTRRWYGIFVPSIADLFFAAVIVWLFVAGAYGWQSLLLDGDVGAHIRIGDHILANRSVPTHDFLAFSRPGQEWLASEWLTEVIFSFLHSQAGLKGVVLLSGVVLAGTFTILLLHTLWRGANIVIALALVLMAVNASSIHFHARPHIFTLLFVAIAAWLIEADRRHRTWALWLLLPIACVWTNLHGGFLVLFALLGLLVAGCLAESFLWGEPGSWRKSVAWRYGLLGVGCGLASLINPYGVKLHLYLREFMNASAILNGVQEFQSPSFRSESMFHYMIMLFLALAITGSLLKKHRLTEILWIWFLAYQSLMSVRHVPLFVIVAVPVVAVEVTAWWHGWVQNQSRRSIAATLEAVTAQFQAGSLRWSLWTPALVLALALSHFSNWPKTLLDGPFPVKIVEAHADEIATSRVYTSDSWAGYLIYRNYPRQRVFFDDRPGYFGLPIIHDYLHLADGSFEWRELLERYRFDLVLCSASSPLASLMKLHPDWKVVEDDGKIILFRKNGRQSAVGAQQTAIKPLLTGLLAVGDGLSQ